MIMPRNPSSVEMMRALRRSAGREWSRTQDQVRESARSTLEDERLHHMSMLDLMAKANRKKSADDAFPGLKGALSDAIDRVGTHESVRQLDTISRLAAATGWKDDQSGSDDEPEVKRAFIWTP